MAIPQSDGKIILEVGVNDQGVKKETRNLKSEAAKLAAEYRKAGLNTSEAMKKAWQEVNKTRKETEKTTESTKKYGKQAQESGQTAKNAIGGVAKSLKSLVAAAGISFGIYGLVNFGKEAANLASDLQEVQNVVDVSFGDLAYRMEEFSKTALETYGMSELTAKQIGSTFMSMGASMGIPLDRAADLSLSLTGLAGDLASFRNVSIEEAQTALAAVFTGETETLKRYGVVMTDINLQEYARQKGIEKSTSAMSQQEKLMLRYSYVMDSLSMAQGDYVRTQDSFANKTKTLSEQWKEMQAVFGETIIIMADALMPAIQGVVKGLTIVALYIAAFARGLSGAKQEVKETKDELDGLGKIDKDDIFPWGKPSVLEKTEQTIKGTAESVNDLNKSIQGLAKFDKVDILGKSTDNFDSLIDDEAFNILVDSKIPDFEKNLSAVEEFIDSDTMKNIQEFEQWVVDNKDAIKVGLEIAGLGLMAGGIANVARKIGGLLGLFSKKDEALVRQTKKTNLETDAVYGLEGAFSSVATLIPFTMIPSLNNLTKYGQNTFIPYTENFAKKTATAFDTAFQGVPNSFFASLEKAEGEMENFSGKVSSEVENINTSLETIGTTIVDVFKETANSLTTTVVPNAQTKPATATQPQTQAVAPPTAQEAAKAKRQEKGQYEVGQPWQTQESLAYFNSLPEETAKATEKALETGIIALGLLLVPTIGPAIAAGILGAKTAIGSAIASALAAGGLATVPAMATGGIVPTATLALVGEKGREAVLPLEGNTSWMDALVDRMLQRGALSSSAATEVVLELDGRELGRAIVEKGNEERRRLGAKLAVVR